MNHGSIVVLFQTIALRGHRKGCDFLNIGNFLELFSQILHQQLESGHRNAKYISPDMLRLVASNVITKLFTSVKRAGLYYALVDENILGLLVYRLCLYQLLPS